MVFLAFSNNAARIREIVKSRLYYPPVNMAGKRREELDDQIMIVDTGLGDQLQFTNPFAWHACYKFRDFFCDVYARVREMGLVSSSSEIRTDVELPLSEIAVFNDPGGED
jgi:hypothetical protein